MSLARREPTDNEKIFLISEVHECCPICQRPLLKYKGDKIIKVCQMAHIYPLHPTEIEKEILKDCERLSDDPNDLNNFIALCSDCHKKYDTFKTKEEYEKMLRIKKMYIADRKIHTIYSEYQIEKEIKEILKKITSFDIKDTNIELTYSAKTINEKLKDENLIFIRKIKGNVVDYYQLIKDSFLSLEENEKYLGIFEIIATQIKSFYLKTKQEINDKEKIFELLVDWLYKKTDSEFSKITCEIMISFFIQNCEVFK